MRSALHITMSLKLPVARLPRHFLKALPPPRFLLLLNLLLQARRRLHRDLGLPYLLALVRQCLPRGLNLLNLLYQPPPYHHPARHLPNLFQVIRYSQGDQGHHNLRHLTPPYYHPGRNRPSLSRLRRYSHPDHHRSRLIRGPRCFQRDPQHLS